MSSPEASPREAAAAATAAAVVWLERELHDGPRYSAQLRREAVAAGLQIPALHRAGNELGIVRIQASRWSRWALKEHAEATTERRCPACHEIKDRERFRRPPAPSFPMGRVMPVCNPCADRRSCRTDKRRPEESPALTEALIDRTASFAPDPGVAVALRRELVAARRAGETFSAAWPNAMADALRTAAPRERDDWRDVLLETHGAWRSAYDRDEDAQAAHGALSILAEAA